MPNGVYDTEDWPVGSRFLGAMKDYEHVGDRSGWVENSDGTYSYLIRMYGNKYVRSKQTVTKREAFKYILQGDKKGIDD